MNICAYFFKLIFIQFLSLYFQYACELSRTETRNKSDKSDELKEKAEDEIWSEKEAIVQGAEKEASVELPNEKSVRYVFAKR